MKLEKILDKLGSIEKNSFIKVIDAIISSEPKNIKQINKILNSCDKGLKTIDNQNISKIFSLITEEFQEYLKTEFQEVTTQFDILIDIITRDGNCIMKQDWFSRLYEYEIKKLKSRIKILQSNIKSERWEISENRKRDYRIYKSCLHTAYYNDQENNREVKITSDENSIILRLAKELKLSQEEIKLINYSILPIKQLDINEVIKWLKNIGVVFYSNKENTVYIADEMVRSLRTIRKKEVAEKFYRRTLKLLREPVINQIARNYNINRDLSYSQKVEEIIKEGIPFTDLLLHEIYKQWSTLTQRKKEINDICEKWLNISYLKGSTLEEKISSLIIYFEETERDEKIGLPLDGFDKLLGELSSSLPKLNSQIKEQFELQDDFVLTADYLLDYNIKPRDILDLIDKKDRIKFLKDHSIKQRGIDILNILEHYKDVKNLYLENYENVAYRNLNLLKDNWIIVKESELWLKFEELTANIFEELGFDVDNKFRNKLNTKKDKIDILVNLWNQEVIIIECKTNKERWYNKFSSVSRQLKAYQNLALKNELRIVKTLLIAPEFSDDFITDCEMDTEINISLITASTLYNIFETFKTTKLKEFPYVLFRDIVVDEKRVLKAIQK